MCKNTQVMSKVLILDNSAQYFEQLKQFCDQNNLIGLKVNFANMMSILNLNVDLGAILLASNYCDTLTDTAELAMQIHQIRPELPIMLRLETNTNADLPTVLLNASCITYSIDNLDPLRQAVEDYIFSTHYPNVLVRGIAEISVNALSNQFKHLSVTSETPYIVRDRIIFGEVFSLIPIESSWCRGYMMLQTEDEKILSTLNFNLWNQDNNNGFRTVNHILAEVTNLIWGVFKNRFISDEDSRINTSTQVPIVINHVHRYISFGSENPQLCFKYTLRNESNQEVISIDQRFIFNLNWSPEDFKEVLASVDDLVEAGELELF